MCSLLHLDTGRWISAETCGVDDVCPADDLGFRKKIQLIFTHWGRVTHICVSELTIIGSDNGLSPGRRKAIIWTNRKYKDYVYRKMLAQEYLKK